MYHLDWVLHPTTCTLASLLLSVCASWTVGAGVGVDGCTESINWTHLTSSIVGIKE